MRSPKGISTTKLTNDEGLKALLENNFNSSITDCPQSMLIRLKIFQII